MAKPRKRFDPNGKPLPCAVTIPPELAADLYEAKSQERFRDETELVVAIVRDWSLRRLKQRSETAPAA